MRLLFALLLVTTSVLAAPNVLDSISSLKTLPNYYPDLIEDEPIHLRAKRAIFAALGLTNSCEPGWTGVGCANPICTDPQPSPTKGQTNLIELLFLKGNCAGQYYIPVDSNGTSPTQTIQIHVSASGLPYINMTNEQGVVVPATFVTTTDGYSLSLYSDLPSGGYSLTIDNQNAPTTECIVEVNSDTSLKLIQGFVRNPQTDDTPFGESAIDGLPMYLVAHIESGKTPSQVQSVTIRQGNSLTPIYRSVLTQRYQCGYEWYAGQWQCQLGNSYYYHIDGVDGNGYKFRRTGRITCMQLLTSPAPPTTTVAPITNCFNNGTILNINGVNQCFCSELFNGRQCDQVNCLNGGFPDPDNNLCACAPGYHGTNCQDVTCPLNWEPFLVDFKTLIIVIHSTTSMNGNLDAIATAVYKELTTNVANDYDVYKGYVLVKFANGVYTNNYYPTYNQDKFLGDIKAPSTTGGACADATFDAIASIFTEVAVYQKSPIYLFTDSIASDSDKWQTVIEMNTRMKYPIYTHFFTQSGCNFDELSDGYLAIGRATYFSGGLVIQPDPTSLQHIFQNIIKATAYKMNSVLIDDVDVCSTPTRVFFVDSSTTELMIVAIGDALTVSVTDPNGDTNTFLPTVTSGTTYIYEVANPVVGEHLLTVVSSTKSPCSYRVQARSEYDLFIGTSTGVNDDASDSEPVVGQTTHVVAQLSGLVGQIQDQFRLFSEISITSNVNTDNMYQKPMYYSSGKFRSGCGFHMYFGAASFCDFISQPFYATVYADDGRGYTIQRTTTGFCSGQPTTPQPPNTCVNGGVTDPTNNSTCICPANFYGKYCENIACVNGGTARGGQCVCPVGTGGTFCEQYMCTVFNQNPDVSFDRQSIAFVISTRSTMKNTVNVIANNVQTMTRDMQQASDKWINKWILIAVNSNTTSLLVQSDKPADFVQAVQDLATNFDQYKADETSCQVQLEQAMLGATMLSERRSSVWVFTDSDGPNDTSYIQLYDVSQQYQINLNLVGVGSSICTKDGSSGQFPVYLKSLSETTLGQVYMTDKIDQIMLFIVSMYKSAVSHRYFIPDCTQKTSYYMPVDGWTQSLTLAVTGTDLNSASITFPDGTPGQDSYFELVAINDPELKLNQYISACDGQQFWNTLYQNCYQFQSNSRGWLDSWSTCHDEKAYLIHIDRKEINDFVFKSIKGYRAWIGLAYNNGQWYWDVPDNNLPQPLTGYTNWAPGVDPTNPQYNHVVMNEVGQWEPADPNQENFVACMKHRYGQGYFPGEAVNVVPGGLWKVTVQSNSGSCEIQARSQSAIQVFFGFTTDPRSDSPQQYANIDSNSNYLIVYPTGVIPYGPDTKPSMEARLNYAVLSSNRTITNSLPLTNRLCTYSVVSSPFTCPDTEGGITDFSVKFTGIDQYGYAFERYADTLCTKTITSCANGGFPNNGKCVCRAGWVGTDCSTPVCQNGGIEKAGVCDCSSVPQFTGQFCQLAHCEPPVPTVFTDTGRTLAIVLETSYNMGSSIFQLKRNLKASLDSIKADPTLQGWFTKFVLYPFDSTANQANWYPPTTSINSDDIVNAVKNISTMSCPGPNPCSAQCPRPIVNVLKNVLEMDAMTAPNSVILVITRSSPEDYLQVGSIAQKLQDMKAYINFVYPAIDSPCSGGWNTAGADALFQITSYSQGNVFTMNAVELSKNFLTQYIPTLYSSGGIASSDGQCDNNEIMFQVEHEMYEFSLDFYHPLMGSIQVFDPSGDQLPLPDNIITSDTNYIGIFPVNEAGATRAGTYRVVLSGGGGANCFATIRGRSSLELFLGFVDSDQDKYMGATVDAALHAPVNLENNTIVVHANNLGAGRVRYVQIVMPFFGLVHTTEMKLRNSECSYEWYSAVPFSFDYDHYYVIIYGSSEYGSNWVRNFYVSTVSSRPPIKPPPASCTLSDKKQDTLFIIDSSLKESDTTFSILKHFAATSMQPFSYSDGKAQVGAMTVADKPVGGFSFNAPESDYEKVATLLNGLPYQGVAGQNVTSAFEYALNFFDQPAQGYRPDPDVRHLLVYVTNTNPSDADPSSLVSTIKRSGLYEVIIVALDMQPADNLKNIVRSDCFYLAADFHDLMNFGVNFVQGQSCMRFNFCNY